MSTQWILEVPVGPTRGWYHLTQDGQTFTSVKITSHEALVLALPYTKVTDLSNDQWRIVQASCPA